jgi:large subunit ribosomal protein L19
MTEKNKKNKSTDINEVKPGDTVKVHQKIKEKDKQRIQIFEGVVLSRKHGNEPGATITVRRIISGVGVERIFPIHSPNIEKIEVLKKGKVRRAKLYYLRTAKGKKAKLKKREFVELQFPEEEKSETQPVEQ